MITKEDIIKLKRIFMEKASRVSQSISASVNWSNIFGKPSTFPPEDHSQDFSTILNSTWQRPILGISNNGTETAGNRYIVGASPTGNFSGFTSNNIVEYNGSDWISETPEEGWMVYNIGEALPYYFDSSAWSLLSDFFVDLLNNQTVAGVKTFSSFPVTPSSAPSSDYQVANKKYVDDNGGGGGGSFWTTVPKASDELRNSTTTLTNDTDLHFTCTNGNSYYFRMDLLVQFDADADFKFDLSFSGSTSKVQYAIADWQMTTTGGSNTFYALKTSFAQVITVSQSGSTVFYALIKINGFFTVTGDGTLNLRWAQNVSHADNVGVLAGSILEYKQI